MLDDIGKIDSTVLKPDPIKAKHDPNRSKDRRHAPEQSTGNGPAPEDETADDVKDDEKPHLFDVRI